jgi:hypothetical protein
VRTLIQSWSQCCSASPLLSSTATGKFQYPIQLTQQIQCGIVAGGLADSFAGFWGRFIDEVDVLTNAPRHNITNHWASERPSGRFSILPVAYDGRTECLKRLGNHG